MLWTVYGNQRYKDLHFLYNISECTINKHSKSKINMVLLISLMLKLQMSIEQWYISMHIHRYRDTYLPIIYIYIIHPHKLQYLIITPHSWGERNLKPYLISLRKINVLQYFKRLNWVIYNLKFNRIFPSCLITAISS